MPVLASPSPRAHQYSTDVTGIGMDARNINHHHEGFCPHDQVLHIRTVIPADWGIRLGHIVVDLGITKAEALQQAIALFLRFHGHADGIPEPLLPIEAKEKASR